eukprot:s726_g35.t1
MATEGFLSGYARGTSEQETFCRPCTEIENKTTRCSLQPCLYILERQEVVNYGPSQCSRRIRHRNHAPCKRVAQ